MKTQIVIAFTDRKKVISHNIIHRKESFAYGLSDFPRKDDTLSGSKLIDFFKQIQ